MQNTCTYFSSTNCSENQIYHFKKAQKSPIKANYLSQIFFKIQNKKQEKKRSAEYKQTLFKKGFITASPKYMQVIHKIMRTIYKSDYANINPQTRVLDLLILNPWSSLPPATQTDDQTRDTHHSCQHPQNDAHNGGCGQV
jgi:hypothetical protein